MKKIFYVCLLLASYCSFGLSRLVPVGPRGSPGPGAMIGCLKGPQGPQGLSGDFGAKGETGLYGDPGEDVTVFAPPGTKCDCAAGKAGRIGGEGLPGAKGMVGTPGARGAPGYTGDVGLPGPVGSPGLPHAPEATNHPAAGGMIYVPFDEMGRLPKVMCHHFRRQAFVPGVGNNWLGWHETGQSGFLVYDKWLYYSSRFTCPCSVRDPTPPTPTPSSAS